MAYLAFRKRTMTSEALCIKKEVADQVKPMFIGGDLNPNDVALDLDVSETIITGSEHYCRLPTMKEANKASRSDCSSASLFQARIETLG